MPLIPPIDEDSPVNHSNGIAYEDAYIPSFALVISRLSVVRFRLPLTSPQGTETPPKRKQYRVVGTKDPSVRDVPKLHQSASKWTKTDLDLLGVEYRYDRFDNIPSRVGLEDADMLPELFGSKNLFMPF